MDREILTPEQIAKEAEQEARTDSPLAIRRIINRKFREQDDSHKWPINGAFDATERAIRKACKFEKHCGMMSPLEYALFLDNDISNSVNNCNY